MDQRETESEIERQRWEARKLLCVIKILSVLASLDDSGRGPQARDERDLQKQGTAFS